LRIVSVHLPCQLHLLLIGQTGRLSSLVLGPGEHWKQQRRQNGNNGDHHQQFNQRESGSRKEPAPPFSRRGVRNIHIQLHFGNLPAIMRLIAHEAQLSNIYRQNQLRKGRPPQRTPPGAKLKRRQINLS
jgi:hypothetical protein